MSQEQEKGATFEGDAQLGLDPAAHLITKGNSTDSPAFQRDLFGAAPAPRPLWPHQSRGLQELRDAFAVGFKRPMVQLATGGGKTRLAAEVILRSISKGNRVAFVAPAISLVDQAAAAFHREGIGCLAIMQGDHPLTDATQPVQVISAQTLARRKRPRANLVIVDEAHLMHKSVLQWMADEPDLRFVGLSASPWSRGLGNYYNELIRVADIAELIDEKVLVRPIVYAPAVPDLEGVKVRAGEFDTAELVARVNTAPIVGDIVREWLARAEGRPTVAFAIDRAHARHLQERFAEASIAAAYVDAQTDQRDRVKIFDALARGELKVVSNVGVLVQGVDIPEIGCIVDCAPTRSEIKLVQSYGRGLRGAPGKMDCLVLDHAGNSLRLGLVTDIRHDRLDRTKPGERQKREQDKRAPRLRRCDDCQAVIPAGAESCPQCGAVKHAHCTVGHDDDERLVAFGEAQRERAKAHAAEQLRFYGELKGYAAKKGYKRGWAFAKFRERFGTLPPPGANWQAAEEPSAKTLNWIRSRNIAYAKAQAQAHG